MKKIKKADMIKKGIVNLVRNEIKTLSLADNLYILICDCVKHYLCQFQAFRLILHEVEQKGVCFLR